MTRFLIGWMLWLACLLAWPGDDTAAPPAAAEAAPAAKVKLVAGIKYFEGEGADAERHLLDLYLPPDAKDFPVVMWVHGGGWRKGSKEQGAPFLEALAQHGLGVASVGYRLAPEVKHPQQIEDVARAFAWLHKHAAEHGGDPKRIFVGGISAGGHLSALLALEPKYLKAHELEPAKHIAGALPVSGVYRLEARYPLLGGMVRDAFGEDETLLQAASPIDIAAAGAPPFYILYAQRDPRILRDQAVELHEKLKAGGNKATVEEVADTGHLTILKGLMEDGHEVTKRLLEFIRVTSEAR